MKSQAVAHTDGITKLSTTIHPAALAQEVLAVREDLSGGVTQVWCHSSSTPCGIQWHEQKASGAQDTDVCWLMEQGLPEFAKSSNLNVLKRHLEQSHYTLSVTVCATGLPPHVEHRVNCRTLPAIVQIQPRVSCITSVSISALQNQKLDKLRNKDDKFGKKSKSEKSSA